MMTLEHAGPSDASDVTASAVGSCSPSPAAGSAVTIGSGAARPAVPAVNRLRSLGGMKEANVFRRAGERFVTPINSARSSDG